jgi:hypothetical protein
MTFIAASMFIQFSQRRLATFESQVATREKSKAKLYKLFDWEVA